MAARLLGVHPRTVRRWRAGAPSRLGRPPLEWTWAKMRAIARAWRRQGRSAGWRPVWRALEHLSRRLVQRVVAELKRRHRARTERRLARCRTSIEVAGRDVMWSLDATHLGRDEAGHAVEAQALREVATQCTLAATVGGVTTTKDAIAIVCAAAERHGGRLPLVLVTDNGAAYTSGCFERLLEEHGVVHLLSLPRTPQHNAWVERGNRDLKEESGLGRGVLVRCHEDAAQRLAAALERLDGHRLRRALGYRTARAVDRELPVPYDDSVRDRLIELVAQRTEEGVHDQMTKRARRVLRREAVLASLEKLGMIRRTRGGTPRRAVKQDIFS